MTFIVEVYVERDDEALSLIHLRTTEDVLLNPNLAGTLQTTIEVHDGGDVAVNVGKVVPVRVSDKDTCRWAKVKDNTLCFVAVGEVR